MLNARARVIFKGRVQGVFYRAYTESTAKGLGITGWVRNMPDGSVEAVFEGGREAILKAIEFCRSGPPASRVTGVDVEWDTYRGEFGSFSIKYH